MESDQIKHVTKNYSPLSSCLQRGYSFGKIDVYINCLHLDIKEGKIWIWQNNTDAFVADDLVERGIPKTDIVLAFNAPQERQFTGFAVA